MKVTFCLSTLSRALATLAEKISAATTSRDLMARYTSGDRDRRKRPFDGAESPA